ncbi:MAG: hypothetical protein IIV45_05180 [Lachnospiraceae bacterium]|nr:hypothetical protein [Lachnospiraceae bacterium]
MAKRKQQYELEKNLEYGGIEKMEVDPKARAKFKAPAFEPMHLPRYDVIGFLKEKGHDVGRVIDDGQKDS